jgi:hypothetical protein
MSTPYVLRNIDETKILFETHWVIIEVDAVITELFIAHVVSKKEHILSLFFVFGNLFRGGYRIVILSQERYDCCI